MPAAVPPLDLGLRADGDHAAEDSSYHCRNVGGAELRWFVMSSEPWVVLAPASGVLPPGESVTVRVAAAPVDPRDPLPERPPAELRFLDSATGGSLAVRTVTYGGTAEASGLDALGWTTFTPSPDTRTVYVSSSLGNDANNGLSEAAPKRTIGAGRRLMRHGYPDWLLLRRGDAWDEPLGYWVTSGRSEQEPQLVSAYGTATARPLVRSGLSSGLDITVGGNAPPSLDNLAVVGLHFHAHTYNGTNPEQPQGLRFVHVGRNILVEDCRVEGYYTNVVLMGYGGKFTNLKFRRNVVDHAYTTLSGHTQGFYVSDVDGLLVEDNVFDHNGWSETIAGAGANGFRHGLYIQNGCTGVVVRGNIISNSASHGLQLRPGGVVTNNLFLRNSISLLVGSGNTPEPGGIKAKVVHNVILDGKNIDANNPRGWGLQLANIREGLVSKNVIANNTLGTFPVAFDLQGDSNGSGVRDTLIRGNVLSNWGGSFLIQGNTQNLTNVTFLENDLQNTTSTSLLIQHYQTAGARAVKFGNCRFHSIAPTNSWMRIGSATLSFDAWRTQVGDVGSVRQQVSYPNPTASIGAYHASILGVPTHEAFMAEARLQSKSNWRWQYTARAANTWFRAAFGMN